MTKFWVSSTSQIIRTEFIRGLWVINNIKTDIRISNFSLYKQRFTDFGNNFVNDCNFYYLNIKIIADCEFPRNYIDLPMKVHPFLQKGL